MATSSRELDGCLITASIDDFSGMTAPLGPVPSASRDHHRRHQPAASELSSGTRKGLYGCSHELAWRVCAALRTYLKSRLCSAFIEHHLPVHRWIGAQLGPVSYTAVLAAI